MSVASLEFAKPLQVDEEFDELLALLVQEDVRSYLEIGARYGGSFERIMMALPEGACGVAVDFPGGPFGDPESAPILLQAITRLRTNGRDVRYVFGPSAAPEVIKRVEASAAFDAVMIDGDHAAEAVENDLLHYGWLAPIVILHDIAAPEHVRSHDGRTVEVPEIWRRIKPRWRKYREIVAEGSLMGIGVLWR